MQKILNIYLLLCIPLLVGITACSSGNSSNTNPCDGNLIDALNYPYSLNNYSTFLYPYSPQNSSTLVTGIRGVDNSTNVYITSIYRDNTTTCTSLYSGPINGNLGSWYLLNYPSSLGATVTSTSLYGPNNGNTAGTIQVVGNYTTLESANQGFGLLYFGPTDGFVTWRTLTPESNAYTTIAHSVMGGLVVGNYNINSDIAPGKAFIYDIATESYTELTHPGAISITAYGIWYNGGESYTIAGGFSEINNSGLDKAYLVDYNSSTHTISNWTEYTYNNLPIGAFISHFEGITTDGNSGYNMAADWISATNSSIEGGSFVHITRANNGSFESATWTDVAYPNATITSANTVYLDNILGVYTKANDSNVYGFLVTNLP